MPLLASPVNDLLPRPCAAVALIAAGLLSSGAVQAARPMNTDDANVVDPKSCQDESWFKKSRTSIERWSVPGCNFFADTEVSLGTNLQTDSGLQSNRLYLLQAKKRWRVLESGDWGMSSTLGLVRSSQTGPAPAQVHDTYLNVPVTWSLGQDRFAHLNIGWIKHKDQGQGAMTWGLGGEHPLHRRIIAIAETYGEQMQGTKYQLGLRFWVMPQRVQVDTTVGNAVGGSSSQRWLSIGLRLLTPPLY